MKIKLSQKIFAVFLVTSIIVAVLMTGTYRYLVLRHFYDFVNHGVLNRLDGFSQMLIAQYRSDNGWQHLQSDPQHWSNIMEAAISTGDFAPPPPVGVHSAKPQKPPADRPPTASRRFQRSLALFDADKNHIAGSTAGTSAKNYTLQPLTIDGRTVGWFGLYKVEFFSDPLVAAFIKSQRQAFYTIGLVILVIAALVSLLLSKHLLAPIRQLTKGTRALTSFKFDTRIAVRSDDELGQLAKDFNHMADTLKKYEDLRRQWISDISHELRTPIAILSGEIEALQDGIRPVDQSSLASLRAETQRLSKLVTDLHDLSLADSRNLLPVTDRVEPNDILKQMVEIYRSPLNRQGIAVELKIDGNSPVEMTGDANRLAQLYTNLLENTLRYTDQPGVSRITSRREKQRLIIIFEDSAPGVPDESKERIFERLYRLDHSRNRNLGGSGLGLAICRQIVTTHGGSIHAQDSDLGGLGIRIELPL